MLVRDVMAAIDRLAPFHLAEPWDHVGLQVGARRDEVEALLVAVEVDRAALAEAARLGCTLVVVHHPLIHDPLEHLSDASEPERLALHAAREGIAVIAVHTNLDKARGGIADIVAHMLGLEAAAPLAPAAADALKLVGFVPADDADLVRKAVYAAGAGVIGEYEHCSWAVEGQGTFFGREGATSPAAGQAGRDEAVNELRLEVVFPRRLRRRVTGAYVAAHPYEEPAYDVYAVENEIATLGLGRVGELPAAMPLAAFAAEAAAALGLPSLRYAGDGEREVKRVAVLPGSGAEAIAQGVAQVADVLVTGDVKYHDARAAQAQNLALVDAPHGATEQEAVLRWAETLADALGAGVRVETYRNLAVAVWREASASDVAEEASVATTEPVRGEVSPSTQASGLASAVAPGEAAEGGPAAEATSGPVAGARTAAPAAVAANGEPPTPVPAGARSAPTPDRKLSLNDQRFRLYADGGARGNPGPAGIGARLLNDAGDLVEELSDYIGEATNNVAEYQALLSGLELALDHGVQRLDVFLDSELVVRQLNGQYKVKNGDLKVLHDEAVRLMHQLHEVKVQHVRREQNAAADALVNKAIDAAT